MQRVIRRRSETAGAEDASDREVFVIEESLGYLVNRLARSLTRALSTRLAPHGVSVAQWAVLIFLWADDGPTQRALSRHVAIDEATMARTLDRMERDGLVRRSRNPRDRRQINVHLTDQARGLCDALVPAAAVVNEMATAQLTEAEREQVSDLLRRMIASLDTSSDQERSEP